VSTRAVLHPAALLAIALLAINDHLLKAAWPGWWTGKLSDFAGLAFFPLLVAAAGELAGLWRSPRQVVVATIAITAAVGVGFALVKLSPAAGDLYRVGLAGLQWPVRAAIALVRGGHAPALGRVHLTADPTDLIALPALLMPVLLVRAVVRSERGVHRHEARGPDRGAHLVRSARLRR
jgi:hypothetical protein